MCLIYRINILCICILLLSGCGVTLDKNVKYTRHYADWCMGCANLGFVECAYCWKGRTLSDYSCWKCKGSGVIKCPDCYGRSNPNGEWKLRK